MQGVKRAYFCFPIAPGMVQATAQFAQASREVGVDVIVTMSQKIARKDAHSHDAFDHWLSERVFDWSGVPVTHLRPTFFAEWLLYLSPMIQQGTMYVPLWSRKGCIYSGRGSRPCDRTHSPGPEASSRAGVSALWPGRIHLCGACAEVSRVLKRDIGYQQVPFKVLREAFTTGGENVARNDSLTGYATPLPKHRVDWIPHTQSENHCVKPPLTWIIACLAA